MVINEAFQQWILTMNYKKGHEMFVHGLVRGSTFEV